MSGPATNTAAANTDMTALTLKVVDRDKPLKKNM